MNILHISPYLPSLLTNHAGGVCMGRQIETLRENHQVYVLSFIASPFDEKLAKQLQGDKRYHFVKLYQWGKRLHVVLSPWMPCYFAVRSSVRFACKLIWLVYHYRIDAIHGEYASMAQYQWICRLFPGLRYYMTEHDVTTQSYERKHDSVGGWKKCFLSYQIRRLFHYEQIYCQRADAVLTFSEKDKTLLERQYGISEVRVLNPYFGIEDSDLDTGERKRGRMESDTLCFLGQMGRDENIVAAQRLISIQEGLNKAGKQVKIFIVGNNPPQSLKKMESDNIHITGFIEDVDGYVLKACVAVFPLTLGAGIKLKVLRSMALGTPVITTDIGAEGIDEKGEVLLLAESDDEFISKILDVINLTEKDYQHLSSMCREYVREYFGWERSEKILNNLYKGN